MRHLIAADKAGLWKDRRVVAELGPGDSFGIGLAALLSGADEYYALDAKAHANVSRNLEIFEELLDLFKKREPIPDLSEFPNIFPPIDNNAFPSNILTQAILARTLAPARTERIRLAIHSGDRCSEIQVSYIAPWSGQSAIRRRSLDMVFSQAVLEHVDDVQRTYQALAEWIRPSGLMSHVIDYKSHGLTTSWNDHWTLSDRMWTVIRGKRPYLINRWAHSQHVNAIKEAGFEVITEMSRRAPGLSRAKLAPRFRSLTDEDLICPGSFIQAVRQ